MVIDPDRNMAVWDWGLANEAYGNISPNTFQEKTCDT